MDGIKDSQQLIVLQNLLVKTSGKKDEVEVPLLRCLSYENCRVTGNLLAS